MAMKKAPTFLSIFSLNAISSMTIADPNRAYEPVSKARPPEIVIGKNNGPIPIAKRASKIQLPRVFPIAI